jgi:hypothetical protein
MGLLSGNRRSDTRTRISVFTAALWFCAGLPLLSQESIPSGEEYQIKAAFLYNFGKFVGWPGAAANSGEPLVIAVFGPDPFGPVLDQMVQGRLIRGRPVIVRRPTRIEDLLPCQILFVSSSEKNRLAGILEAVGGAGVLVVGEMDGFLRLGGMIAFSVEQAKVRFEINEGAARRNGLRIDSKLLTLGKAAKAAR